MEESLQVPKTWFGSLVLALCSVSLASRGRGLVIFLLLDVWICKAPTMPRLCACAWYISWVPGGMNASVQNGANSSHSCPAQTQSLRWGSHSCHSPCLTLRASGVDVTDSERQVPAPCLLVHRTSVTWASCVLLLGCKEEGQRSCPTRWPRLLACLSLCVLISSPVTVLHEYSGLEVSEGRISCVLMASTMLVLPISVLGSKGTEKQGRLGTD